MEYNTSLLMIMMMNMAQKAGNFLSR